MNTSTPIENLELLTVTRQHPANDQTKNKCHDEP